MDGERECLTTPSQSVKNDSVGQRLEYRTQRTEGEMVRLLLSEPFLRKLTIHLLDSSALVALNE
jgi:hypothetical protein